MTKFKHNNTFRRAALTLLALIMTCATAWADETVVFTLGTSQPFYFTGHQVKPRVTGVIITNNDNNVTIEYDPTQFTVSYGTNIMSGADACKIFVTMRDSGDTYTKTYPIQKRPITVQIDSWEKTVGEPDPEQFTWEMDPATAAGVQIDSINNLRTNLLPRMIHLIREEGWIPGEYAIYMEGGSNTGVADTIVLANYKVAVRLGKLTINSTSITYIDAGGQSQTKQPNEYSFLTGNETTLDAGWYYVGQNIQYTQTLQLNGDVNLILGDGYTMKVGTSSNKIDGNGIEPANSGTPAFTIYGQANGTGKLNAYATATGITAGSVTINSGKVNVNGQVAIATSNTDITLNGGQVDAIGTDYGLSSARHIILDYHTPSDYYHVSSYSVPATGSVAIVTGKSLTDGTTTYSGTISNPSVLAGKTLHPSSHTVTFDVNYSGGTNPASQVVDHGATASAPSPNPTRTGYTFDEWRLNGTHYDFSTPVMSNITLKAHWNPITYTVVFDKNNENASGTMASVTLTYDEPTNLPANTFTAPEHYAFGGWNTAADGSGTFYENATWGYFNLTSEPNGIVTLYAQWGKDINYWCTATVPDQTMSNSVYSFVYIYYKFEAANDPENGIVIGSVVKDKFNGDTLVLSRDYQFRDVRFANGDEGMPENIGDLCTVEIEGKGNYSGTITANFTIIGSTGSGAWNGLSWEVNDSGELSITGTGTMPAAADYSEYPWFDFASCIKSITIGEGITSIAAQAFGSPASIHYYSNLETVSLPSTLTDIGNNAFAFCTGLTTINNFPQHVTIGTAAFYNVPCVATLEVEGYGDSEISDKWVFIASPVKDTLRPSAISNFMATNATEYDLYRFNQSNYEKVWENYKATTPSNHFDFTKLVNGKGYLYATKETKTLCFVGNINKSNDTIVALAYDPEAEFADWNLVGNPFQKIAYANRSYYKMNEDGTAIDPVAVSTGTAIPACTGVMIHAESTEVFPTVTFSKTRPETSTNNGLLQIAMNQVVESIDTPASKGDNFNLALDKVIISFNSGDQLGKFVFNEDKAKIYIPQNGKDFAIAFSEGQNEMPLNFKPSENGTYTLSVNVDNAELDYLHLIDNLTGADVDLLSGDCGSSPQINDSTKRSESMTAPSYTFQAKTTDYESRFKLVFVANHEDGSSTGSETFAFYSNGNWIISNEGRATLQVIDVTGRIVSSETINGSVSKGIDAASGVYLLRLVSSDNIRTQKIVVR